MIIFFSQWSFHRSAQIAANVSGLAEVPHATLFKYKHILSCGIFGKPIVSGSDLLSFKQALK
jgi:hypothetical protein